MSTTSTDVPDLSGTRWVLDPARSRVEFASKTFWGLMTVKGHFDRYAGTLDLSGDPAVELTVEAASLDTGNAKRDTHLRSADFFDAEAHPQVRFMSEQATLSGDRLSVRGVLHARGSSLPLSLDATLRGVDGGYEIDAHTDADHRALGMTFNQMGMLRGLSALKVQGRLVPAG